MKTKTIVKILKNDGVIIFPTETIYGLGCDATNEKAIKKIYKIKNRSVNKPFPILIDDFKMLKKYAKFDKKQKEIIKNAKKPTTFILKAKNLPKPMIKNGNAAFRISSHIWVKRLLKFFKKPIIATSANVSGQLPLKDPRKYKEVFKEKAKLINGVIFAGIIYRRKPSKIIDLTSRPYRLIRN